MPDTITFTPASKITDRHAMVVALEAPPNAGKTYSGCRLAKGMADAQGKRFAVVDTEGGRTLHLRKHFDFDVTMLGPPHTPDAYLRAAQAAQVAGYGALLIDSFSNVWRGIGGVLHWSDEELEALIERERINCERYNRQFDEASFRDKAKPRAFIRPKTAFKFMMAGLLDLRMPIVLSIRGELTFDFATKKEAFKAHMNKGIGFDVTCRFRLMPDRKGIIDTGDSEKFKMEGDHAAIFQNGAQLSEEHGRLLNAWATNEPLPGQVDRATEVADALVKMVTDAATEEAMAEKLSAETEAKQVAWLKSKRPELYTKLNDAIAAKRKALGDGGLPL